MVRQSYRSAVETYLSTRPVPEPIARTLRALDADEVGLADRHVTSQHLDDLRATLERLRMDARPRSLARCGGWHPCTVDRRASA